MTRRIPSRGDSGGIGWLRGDGGGREANDEAVQQNTASAPKTSPEGSEEERVRVSCAKRATNARRTGLCPFTVCRSVVARLPPPSRRRWQPRRQSEWRRGDVLRRQSVWRDCRLPPRRPDRTLPPRHGRYNGCKSCVHVCAVRSDFVRRRVFRWLRCHIIIYPFRATSARVYASFNSTQLNANLNLKWDSTGFNVASRLLGIETPLHWLVLMHSECPVN